jgi:gliding motility-associated-like protein
VRYIKNTYYKFLIFAISIFFLQKNTNAQVQASFIANPLSGCAPHLVQFTSTSTGAGLTYIWDLGNGTQSTIANPSATYFIPGAYNIKLVVTNSAGQKDSITKNQYIDVFAKPQVNFIASDTIGCFPLITQFTDLSTAGSGNILSWQWDFGDGTGSSIQNPSHTYAQGTYTVVLRVTNDKGCATTYVKPNYIKALLGIQSSFNFISPNSCSVPVTINFNNTSTGTGVLSYNWAFGDGGTSTSINPSHTYNANGTYNVVLTVNNNQGCTNTFTYQNAISIGTNIAKFTAPDSVCVGANVNIVNTSTPTPGAANWSFGDGTFSTAITPTKTYTTPGNYVIKLVANFGACSDSITKNITVIAKPTVSFSTNDTASCKVPFTVNFNSIVSNGNIYNWNFGDGGSSTTPNPTHIYSSMGIYNVSLTVTNSFGCATTLLKNNYIKIGLPTLSFVNLPDSGCNPLTIVPQVLINAFDGVASYSWDFGDGFTTTTQNPSHTYTIAGVYTIKLTIITNGGCTETISSIVKVGNKPVVDFTANPIITCAFYPVTFTDLTTGSPLTSYYWQFGDGGSSFDQNPVYEYQDTGFYNVTLTVSSNGCKSVLKKFNYIYIKPPVARFTPVLNCNNPYSVNFTDESIAPLKWYWQFGDGVIDSIQNPTHIYALPGVYTVILTVSNGTCSHTKSKTVKIIDEHPDFSADKLVICKGSSINFSSLNYIKNNINSITWNFGDGTILIGDSTISHTYTQAGQYTIQLITVDYNGCTNTVSKNQYITVYGPTANFASAVPGSCLNSAVLFNDLSLTDATHPLTNWEWNYGDGSIQNYIAPPFMHTYSGQGIYSISLKVKDSYGCVDSITKPSFLIISKPNAAFVSPDTLFCPNKDIIFTNNSVGNNLTYTWHFGDGNTSNATNPVHQYLNDGSYTISLYITDIYGCKDSIIKPQYVVILSPEAKFQVSDSFGTCPPLFVQFTNNSTNYLNNTWEFGDGSFSTNSNPTHFYTSPGTFIAKLTVTSIGGCVSVFSKTIKVKGPDGTFSYGPLQGCNPLTINFTAITTNTASYVWDFNNGQTISNTTPSVTYTYNQVGKFLPRMILKDNIGCSIPIYGADSITIFGVQNNVGSSTTKVCDSGAVFFNANAISNDIINNYLWKFGDGGTSTAQNPIHNYAASGVYPVSCIVTTQLGCKDTSILQIPISVIKSPQIALQNIVGSCIPASALFIPQIIYNDTSALSWKWTFGNGQTSTLMNPPSITYNNAGAYNVTSIVTNSSGCKDTATIIYNAFGLPMVNAGLDVQICKTKTTQLNASGALNYTWSPVIGLSCINCPNPFASPDSTKKYYVEGIDGNGCKNKDTIEIKVIQKFVMTQSPGTAFCLGKYVTLNANGANSYLWSPSTGLSATSGTTVVAQPVVTTNYMVVGSDAYSCFKDTAFINIIVHPLPTVNAGNDITIVGGSSTQLNTSTTGGVNIYTWTPVNTLSCINCPNPTATPTKTTKYKVAVENSGGCKNEDEVTVFVICDKGNLFVPNTFSPNSDGMNDILYPRGNGIYSIKTFKIFDRWGELVFDKNNFSANDASKGWNGMFKGKMSLPDVYVYTIEVFCENGTPYSFKGNITLIQ